MLWAETWGASKRAMLLVSSVSDRLVRPALGTKSHL
jgi:hypothetical protein